MASEPRRQDDHAITSLIGGLAVCCAVPLLLLLGVTSVLGLVVGALVAGVIAILAAVGGIALMARRARSTSDTSDGRDDRTPS
jgi:hypothetical protein